MWKALRSFSDALWDKPLKDYTIIDLLLLAAMIFVVKWSLELLPFLIDRILFWINIE